MFSSRLQWDQPPNRLSELLSRKRRSGAAILDLTESNPTHAGVAYPAGIVDSLHSSAILRYDPLPQGLRSARETVASYYGAGVDPDRILLTASTSEAYGYLFKLLADPGDEILSPRPSYPLFEFLAALESVNVVQYPLRYDGIWHIDFAALESAITNRTRAIVLVNPNNPTGSFLKRTELDRLIDVCSRHSLALISDEVFADYAFQPDPDRITTISHVSGVLTFALSGLSKIAGLPQMKLGWIVVNGPPTLRAKALEGLELIADTYLSVGTPVQLALPALLRVQGGIIERVRQNLAVLHGQVTAESRCRVLRVEGGWYATLQVPRTRTEEEWVIELLAEDGVLVQPGFFYDFESEAYLVISLLSEPVTFQAGMAKLLARIDG